MLLIAKLAKEIRKGGEEDIFDVDGQFITEATASLRTWVQQIRRR